MFISDSDEAQESVTARGAGSAYVHGQFLLFLKHTPSDRNEY